MALYATANRDEALDIVQDSMLRLATRYSGRDPSEWPPLFFRIVERRIIDWHRRRKVRRVIVSLIPGIDADEDPLENLPDQRSPTAAQQLDSDRGLDKLGAAIEALPLRQQQVFLLRELQGFDVKQTAEAMQCSAGTVKTHYSRARATLRAALEDHVHER